MSRTALLFKKFFQSIRSSASSTYRRSPRGPERDAREPRRIAEVNLIGTLNVLEASRNSGVQRFVHASTGALFGAAGVGVPEPLDEERHRPVPESMYGITKYAAERSCLRLAALWGLDMRIGRLALADAKAPSHRLYHLGTGAAWALPAWCELLEKRFPKFRWRESSEGCNVVPLAPGTRTRFSNRRLVEDLGYAPRFDLAAAADDFVSWLERHP